MDDLELVDLYALPRQTARQAELVDEDSLELPPGALSLEFLQAIYRSSAQPMARRLKAASIAIQYESPKLAVTAVVEGSDSLAARLNRAIERSARVEAYRLIQAAPTAANGHAAVHETAQEVSTAAMHRPMAVIRRR
jgi:hypothetical protein